MQSIHADICRICLKGEGNLKNIFNNEIGGKLATALIEELFGLSLIKPDVNDEIGCQLPNKICERCHCRLELAVELKILAWESHQQIVEWEQQILSAEIKEEHLDPDIVEVVSMEEVPEESSEVIIGDTDTVLENMKQLHETSDSDQDYNSQKESAGVELFQPKPGRPKYPNRIIACQHCPKKFSCRQSLCNHKRIYHNEIVGEFKCVQCEKYFASRVMLNRHVETHNGNMFSCKICQKKFSLESILKRHMHLHKEIQREMSTCKRCRETYMVYKYKNATIADHECEKQDTKGNKETTKRQTRLVLRSRKEEMN